MCAQSERVFRVTNSYLPTDLYKADAPAVKQNIMKHINTQFVNDMLKQRQDKPFNT
jgi:hypothetical protein